MKKRRGTNKVNLAIFDKTLRCSINKYPLNDTGNKIVIDKELVDLNPTFDSKCALEIPRPKRAFWQPKFSKLYFVMSGATECVDFDTPNIPGPDPEAVLRAAENRILTNMGTEEIKTPAYVYLIILLLFGIAIKIFGGM